MPPGDNNSTSSSKALAPISMGSLMAAILGLDLGPFPNPFPMVPAPPFRYGVEIPYETTTEYHLRRQRERLKAQRAHAEAEARKAELAEHEKIASELFTNQAQEWAGNSREKQTTFFYFAKFSNGETLRLDSTVKREISHRYLTGEAAGHSQEVHTIIDVASNGILGFNIRTN